MAKLEALLRQIAERPGMFVGCASLRAVAHYLDGYCQAVTDLGQENPLDGWNRWIELRFEVYHPAWGWPRILLRAYGSNEAALESLPGLYQAFLAERDRIGPEGIQERHDRTFTGPDGASVCREPKLSIPEDLKLRFDAALGADDPRNTLEQLARELQAEGLSQVELYRLYSQYQDELASDDPRYDAVTDILDLIWGGPWAKGRALFERQLHSEELLRS